MGIGNSFIDEIRLGGGGGRGKGAGVCKGHFWIVWNCILWNSIGELK